MCVFLCLCCANNIVREKLFAVAIGMQLTTKIEEKEKEEQESE